MSVPEIDAQLLPVVHHYTSADTLLKIFSKEIIWASNIRYLNDHSEHQFYMDELRSRIPEFLKTHADVSKDYFADFTERCEEVKPFNELPFVASFSSLPDSLPQWRAYCAGGNGVSVGFRTSCLQQAKLLKAPLQGKKWLLLPTINFREVSYLRHGDSATLDRIIGDAISAAEKYLEDFEPVEYEPGNYESPPGIEELISFHLEGAAAATKNIAFKEESEYRLLIESYFGTGSYLSYRASRATLVPYMEVKLTKPDQFLETIQPPNWKVTPHFINNVVVGPSANQKLTIDALQYMFAAAGYFIPVEA